MTESEFGAALSRFLDSLPTRPRLLGLGEPRHGFEEFLRVRNRMFGANRDLVTWIREYNAGREPAERLRFDGFDAPLEMTSAASPRGPLSAVRDCLAALVDAALLPAGAAELEDLAGAVMFVRQVG